MTVDLSQYVGQEVEVTYESGNTDIGKVTKNLNVCSASELHYYFQGSSKSSSYTKDGFYWNSHDHSVYNITHIKPLTMKKYEQLEQQIEDLKKEVDRLKNQEEETSKLPHIFDRNRAIKFLEGFNHKDLLYAFSWRPTPQGNDYWSKLYWDLETNKIQKAPDEAIMAIQSWIIQSYENEYGV